MFLCYKYNQLGGEDMQLKNFVWHGHQKSKMAVITINKKISDKWTDMQFKFNIYEVHVYIHL